MPIAATRLDGFFVARDIDGPSKQADCLNGLIRRRIPCRREAFLEKASERASEQSVAQTINECIACFPHRSPAHSAVFASHLARGIIQSSPAAPSKQASIHLFSLFPATGSPQRRASRQLGWASSTMTSYALRLVVLPCSISLFFSLFFLAPLSCQDHVGHHPSLSLSLFFPCRRSVPFDISLRWGVSLPVQFA
ncbi:hypothetical protein IWX50DRAFT_415985 [Phyllosticta citricarpa]